MISLGISVLTEVISMDSPVDVIRELVDEATEHLHLSMFDRIAVALGSILVIIMDILVLALTIEPLYVIQGVVSQGFIGILGYKLVVLGERQTITQLESLSDLSFLIFFASIFSIILVLPSIIYPRKRVPRVHLENAAAGYIVSELAITLLVSFLRIIQDNIISNLPLDGVVRGAYGQFYLEKSRVTLTRYGFLGVSMRSEFMFIGILLVLMSIILVVYIIQYYREVEEMTPLIPNPS
jgi:hypothetical protein